MNDVESWIYLDGPEPEHLRPLLDAFRDVAPATPADKERAVRRFFETLDAELLQSPAPPSAEAPLAPPGAERALPEDGVTVRSPVAPPAHVLVARGALPHASPPHAPLAPSPPARAPAVPAGPTQVLEVPPAPLEPMDALPFRPRRPDQPRAARTLQTREAHSGFGETAPIGDDSIEKARALLPFARSAGAASVVPIPNLTRSQYASLRAELAVQPERSTELLRKYLVVNEAARRTLDEHWQTHFAEHPEERAAFEADVARFTLWLREQQR